MMVLFLQGLLIGLAVSVPLGPIGVICVKKTLTEGRMRGFASGLGITTADGLYAGLAAYSLSAISGFFNANRMALSIIGAVCLLYLGVSSYLKGFPKEEEALYAKESSVWKAYFSTFLITILSPITVLFFLAVFALIRVELSGESGLYSATSLFLGVVMGSFAWWVALTLLVDSLRKKLNINSFGKIHKVSGIVLIFFAFLAAMKAINLL